MKEFKYFLLTEYEQEEEYLRNKHQEGYELVDVKLPGIYTFKKCEPKDMIYRLDFNAELGNKENYIQMFEDYGWEYIQEMNSYQYFRKERNLINEDENEIFGDDESRMDMLKRIITTKMIPVFVIFVAAFLPNFINFTKIAENHPTSIILFIFLFLLLLLYVYIFVRIIVGYQNLKKKYKK